MAGLAPTLRPHLRCLWKVLSTPTAKGRFWVLLQISRPVSRPLLWVASLLLRVHGDLQRVYDVNWGAPATFCTTIDVSPWGMSGVLQSTAGFASYWFDGGPQINALREALAVLVSLRVWRQYFARNTLAYARSGNLGALAALTASDPQCSRASVCAR
eukprot:8251336-Alexandrium_andersonii.AAC.1